MGEGLRRTGEEEKLEKGPGEGKKEEEREEES